MTKQKTIKETENRANIQADIVFAGFLKAFGIEVDNDKPLLTGQYYGFLGYNEYMIRFSYKGRKYTKVFAPDLQTAKNNLTQNQKCSLFSIEKIN